MNERVGHDRPRAARGGGGKSEPSRVEDLECDLESLTHLAQPVFHRHAHAVERHGARVARLDPHLLLGLPERDTGRVRVHDERRHALLALAVDLDRHLGEHGEDVGIDRIFDAQRNVGQQFLG